MGGRLIILEGPDGVGKTTVAQAVTQRLRERDEPVEYLSFPGREPGSVGELVYRLHHDSTVVGVTVEPHPVSLQVLHIAAHIDAIEKRILAFLAEGTNVVLDRFWWSTWVYGTLAGLSQLSLDRMIGVELVHWGSAAPTMLFLVDRESAADNYHELRDLYQQLAAREQEAYAVKPLDNSGELEDTVSLVLGQLEVV